MQRKLEELNLVDDFLFWAVMSDDVYGPKVAEYLLQTVLQKPVRSVKVHTQKTIYGNDTDLHGIRMDAYIEENDSEFVKGDLYDIEPDQHSSARTELPYRTRYYHALADSNSLGAGEEYKDLRKSYVIMITPYDPFGQNRMVYTVKKSCLEEPEMLYDDGAYTLYLYIGGDSDGMPVNLVHLLQFMKNTTADNAADEHLQEILSMVENIKTRREVQKVYMKFHNFITLERNEARAEGRAEGREEGRAEGREEGRAEQMKNTLKEKERADRAEARVAELEQLLSSLENK